jgi:hypothetical protein
LNVHSGRKVRRKKIGVGSFNHKILPLIKSEESMTKNYFKEFLTADEEKKPFRISCFRSERPALLLEKAAKKVWVS